MRLLLLPLFLWMTLFAQAPNIFLLKSYDETIDVEGWLMSEKLDGVRAIWDGRRLLSRSGRVFDVPAWFIKDFPPFAIDGELWTTRGDFEHITSIVNTRHPHDGWKEITYNIFEVPEAPGGLRQRLQKLQRYLDANAIAHVRIIKQTMVKDRLHLKRYFDEVVMGGGEGVVLRKADVPYYIGRKSESLKYKPFNDDECTVTGYVPGKGRFEGLVGALLCQWEEMVIRIGSGLSDHDRVEPPRIGEQITFKYHAFTKKGIPKYPVYLRVRHLK